jgi:Zn-dependent M28 family amino/carboxypeptidase
MNRIKSHCCARYVRPFGAWVAGALVLAGTFGSLAFVDGVTFAARVVPAELTTGSIEIRPIQPATADEHERDIALYRTHLGFLADPAMEGRAPGTYGNRVAANYIENTYRRLGLRPAFPVSNEKGDVTPSSSFRQVFEARPSERPGDSVRLKSQAASYAGRDRVVNELVSGVDFNAIGYSSSGGATGPLVFVGYGLESESHKYRSIPEGTSLAGKVAVLFRLEPMDENGKSAWAKNDWSFQAGLELKLTTVARAGAAGIILLNPPGADHPDAKTLGDIGLGSRRHQEIPVVMLASEAGEKLVRAADAEGRGLMALRTLADKLGEGESGIIDLPNATVSLQADIERTPLMTDNVGAVLPGVGALANEYVILGAHYDHLGYGYFSSRGGPDARGVIHPGADDNASGTSGVLLAAEKLVARCATLPPDQPRRSVLFLNFSAEESGLEGSKFYVKHPIAGHDQHAIMINMDMIGRLRENRLDLQGISTAAGLDAWLMPQLEHSGITVVPTPGGSGPSDHASFYAWGVPVLFAFTRIHEEYHTPKDTIDTINLDGAARVADLASRLVLDAALRPEKFEYVGMGKADSAANPGPVRGSTRVRFGIAPGDYSGAEKGVLVGEVYPETPAAKAGLRKDDIITHWNGKEVLDVEAWMPFLSDASPGDHVIITFRRMVGDQAHELTADVELVARKTGGQ